MLARRSDEGGIVGGDSDALGHGERGAGCVVSCQSVFKRIHGFGFVTCGDGAEDIFVHMETRRKYGIADLKPGVSLLVRFGPGGKGLKAAKVRPLRMSGWPQSVRARMARRQYNVRLDAARRACDFRGVAIAMKYGAFHG